jgi:1-acyl-sn-glycerol-3-phosphate acyltransferase
MSTTLFDTPLLSPFLRLVSIAGLRLTGWKVGGTLPTTDRFVMIAHPHTSNFDLPLMLAVAFTFRCKLHWIGKEELFTGWKRPFMMWLGGLPIVRRGSQNQVDLVVQHFADRDRIALAIVPGGTRSKTDKWHSGFYWIATEAKVPILLSYLDYKTHRTGVGPLFQPTGNYDEDVAEMQAFYADMRGKYPEKT